MKDIFGQELEVGNVVAFNPPNYKGLVTGQILKFSPKMVSVEYKWCGELRVTSVYPNDLSRASDEIAIMYLLKRKPAKSTT